jgi:hypothetical protein
MIPPGEAVTMLTDYVLALVAFASAAWLWPRAQGRPGRWWAAAFAATGVAAVLGGTSHGYAPVLSTETHRRLWRATYVTVGVANLCILYGAARAALPRVLHRPALAVLVLRLAIVAGALVLLAQFRYVLYDYAITLGGLLALAASLAVRRAPGAGWVLAGVLVSALGGAVQLGRVGHGRAFNHNDWFHVVQAVGLVLYARAARDLGARPSTR